jgi:hypothetical protein
MESPRCPGKRENPYSGYYRTQMFFLTLVKFVPSHLSSPASDVLFDRGSFATFHLKPMEGEGVFLPWNKEIIWNGHGYRQSH